MKTATRLRTLVLTLALLPALRAPVPAYSPLAYPGATWGGISRGFDGEEGTGSQGWVRQGITWAKPLGMEFNTFAEYSWRLRTENKDYYNLYGPGLTAVLEASRFNFGVDYAWLRYPSPPSLVRNSSLFAGWYYSANLAKWTGTPVIAGYSPPGLPFSTWGRLNYDLNGREGSGAQGWVKQGIDWLYLGGWKVNTYAEYNWRLRSRNRTYYDALGPALGVSCSRSGLEAGAEYLWQRFPERHTSARTFNIYLNWYKTWDLKKK